MNEITAPAARVGFSSTGMIHRNVASTLAVCNSGSERPTRLRSIHTMTDADRDGRLCRSCFPPVEVVEAIEIEPVAEAAPAITFEIHTRTVAMHGENVTDSRDGFHVNLSTAREDLDRVRALQPWAEFQLVILNATHMPREGYFGLAICDATDGPLTEGDARTLVADVTCPVCLEILAARFDDTESDDDLSDGERAARGLPSEHTTTDEAEAHAMRRGFIGSGFPVSLIGFDTARGVYAFDVYPKPAAAVTDPEPTPEIPDFVAVFGAEIAPADGPAEWEAAIAAPQPVVTHRAYSRTIPGWVACGCSATADHDAPEPRTAAALRRRGYTVTEIPATSTGPDPLDEGLDEWLAAENVDDWSVFDASGEFVNAFRADSEDDALAAWSFGRYPGEEIPADLRADRAREDGYFARRSADVDTERDATAAIVAAGTAALERPRERAASLNAAAAALGVLRPAIGDTVNHPEIGSSRVTDIAIDRYELENGATIWHIPAATITPAPAGPRVNIPNRPLAGLVLEPGLLAAWAPDREIPAGAFAALEELGVDARELVAAALRDGIKIPTSGTDPIYGRERGDILILARRAGFPGYPAGTEFRVLDVLPTRSSGVLRYRVSPLWFAASFEIPADHFESH